MAGWLGVHACFLACLHAGMCARVCECVCCVHVGAHMSSTKCTSVCFMCAQTEGLLRQESGGWHAACAAGKGPGANAPAEEPGRAGPADRGRAHTPEKPPPSGRRRGPRQAV
jgi:hypothetical protein